jgi:hypothetical protein
MIWVTTYRIKPHLSKAQRKELLNAFAENGPAPGTTAHYVAADGSNGMTVAETDDVAGLYRTVQTYAEWIEFDTKVMLDIEESLPITMEVVS